MKKIKRGIAFFLILSVLTMNIQVRSVHAYVPFIVAGVTVTWEMVLYVAGLMTMAGFVFADMVEMEKAVKTYAQSNETRFIDMIQPFITAVDNGVDVLSEAIPVSVSNIKTFFTDIADYYSELFDYDSSAKVLTTMDRFLLGDAIIVNGNTVFNRNKVGDAAGGFGGTGIRMTNEANYNKYRADYLLRYDGFSQYSVTSYVTDGGDIISFKILEVMSGNTLALRLYKIIKGKETLLGSLGVANTSEPNYFLNDLRSFVVLTYIGTVLYADVVYIYDYEYDIYSTAGEFELRDKVCGFSRLKGDSLVNLSSIYSIPSMTVGVADTSILDDEALYPGTIAFPGTIGVIGEAVGNPDLPNAEDDYQVGILIPGVIPGAEVGDVVVPVDIPINPDIPIDPDIPINPDVPINPDIPIGGSIDFSGLQLNATMLSGVFPFCIPFDFVNAIKSLSVTPKVPYFKMDFSGTVFGNYVWELDMGEYESLAVIVRWSVWVSFFFFLMINTRKFIRW